MLEEEIFGKILQEERKAQKDFTRKTRKTH
jgi:hypothetical protein